MHFSILALLALIPSLASASPTQTQVADLPIGPRALDSSTTKYTTGISDFTNAQRLARGLPIKPPHRRTPSSARSMIPRASAIPRAFFPGDGYQGVIKVTNPASGSVLGYISKNTFDHSQYRYDTEDNALLVKFSTDTDDEEVNSLHINTENSDISDFPLLALVQGREDNSTDFKPGSYDYAYIAGMKEPGTGPGSAPKLSPENSYTAATNISRAGVSSVWSFNSKNSALVPRWRNSDGSIPDTVTFTQGEALYVGSNEHAFYQRFPVEVTPIAFTFVPK